MENRFFEKNPLGAEQVALLSRPGTRLMLEVGTGPIRSLHTQSGVLGGDLFIVSGAKLWRWDGETDPLEIDGDVLGDGSPVMTSVAIPGWEAVFITDGETLQYYEGEGRATGTLTLSGTVTAGDVVRIGSVYYEFVSADVDDDSPAGTSGNPWRILIGGSEAVAFANLAAAINGGGTPGTTRSSALVEHPDVRARSITEESFEVVALEGGTAANSIVTTETSSGLSWGGGTLSGGGDHELKPVEVPDGQAVVDLATLASHVICAIGDSQRFYWLRPGEVVIDPLDFSSAEAEPDFIVGLLVVGDMLWIFGQSSTEAWYASGNADQPFLRTQGRAFSQGVIPGTVARVQEAIFVVGQDRVAYRIAGGPERISHHGIEEMLRRWQDSITVTP